MGAMLAGAAAMAMGNSPATLTLKNDGTGYLKIPNAPERAITWKMDGERIVLSGMQDNKTGSDSSIVGRLSEDKKTLTFDLGPVKFDMKKQEK
jgi:hypothetical protein